MGGHELFHAYQDETMYDYRNSNGNITNIQKKEEETVGFANYLRYMWNQKPYRWNMSVLKILIQPLRVK